MFKLQFLQVLPWKILYINTSLTFKNAEHPDPFPHFHTHHPKKILQFSAIALMARHCVFNSFITHKKRRCTKFIYFDPWKRNIIIFPVFCNSRSSKGLQLIHSSYLHIKKPSILLERFIYCFFKFSSTFFIWKVNFISFSKRTSLFKLFCSDKLTDVPDVFQARYIPFLFFKYFISSFIYNQKENLEI